MTEKTKHRSNSTYPRFFQVAMKNWWVASMWHRALLIFLAIIVLVMGSMFGVARWYISQNSSKPVEFGVTFIPAYAEYLGVGPKETMTALIDDMGIERFRLVSYWNEIEYQKGKYDYSNLDWQFRLAEKKGVDVTLALGLRQPRWPECHIPIWAEGASKNVWYPRLKEFITATVNRYKDSPALISYQLENEFHLQVFGECPDHDRARLIEEFKLVKSIDDTKPLIVTRSNNATVSWPIGEPRADLVGAAIYKRVWDGDITNRYIEYPYPPWFYSFLAGATQITTKRESFIHELQMEPWLPNGYMLSTAPASEMYKSFGPEDIEPRIKYALDTGMKTIDMWGAEWWYFMKKVRQKPEVWQNVRTELNEYRNL